MIKTVFYTDGDSLTGFEISGHAYNEKLDESDNIVCSAVSSAAYMAANTITDVCKCRADAEADDGYMKLTIKQTSESAQIVLKGFEMHIQNLYEQYPKFIQIKYGGAK